VKKEAVKIEEVKQKEKDAGALARDRTRVRVGDSLC
jgi:hypothetical protein